MKTDRERERGQREGERGKKCKSSEEFFLEKSWNFLVK